MDCVNRQIEAIGFEKADNNRWTFSPFTTVDKSVPWTNNGHRDVLHTDLNLGSTPINKILKEVIEEKG